MTDLKLVWHISFPFSVENTKVIMEVVQLILAASSESCLHPSSYSVAVHRARAVVLPVVRHRRESWTVNKAEHQRTNALDLW